MFERWWNIQALKWQWFIDYWYILVPILLILGFIQFLVSRK